jgi:hypothetical protein
MNPETYTDEQINEELHQIVWITKLAGNWPALAYLLQQRTAKPAPSFPALPPGERYSNPQGFTPQLIEVEKGYRPVLESERATIEHECACSGLEWSEGAKVDFTFGEINSNAPRFTYRTRAPLPEHVLRWQAEQQKAGNFRSLTAEERAALDEFTMNELLKKGGDAPCPTSTSQRERGSNAEPKSDPSASALFRITGPGLYRTRDGGKAEVRQYFNPQEYDYPWRGIIGDDHECWDSNGTWAKWLTESRLDIVSDWTEDPAQPTAVEIDWSKVPEVYDWVASDKDGYAVAYTQKPEISLLTGRWQSKELWTTFPGDYAAPDWTKSLVQRPAPELVISTGKGSFQDPIRRLLCIVAGAVLEGCENFGGPFRENCQCHSCEGFRILSQLDQ